MLSNLFLNTVYRKGHFLMLGVQFFITMLPISILKGLYEKTFNQPIHEINHKVTFGNYSTSINSIKTFYCMLLWQNTQF